MLLAGVGVALALFLGAEFAVDLVAGADFEPSVDVLRVLAFALMGTFVIAARGYSLLSLGRLRAMLVSNAVALAVVLGAGIPLISAHGAIGAAIALMAAELALAVCYEVVADPGPAAAAAVGRLPLARGAAPRRRPCPCCCSGCRRWWLRWSAWRSTSEC